MSKKCINLLCQVDREDISEEIDTKLENSDLNGGVTSFNELEDKPFESTIEDIEVVASKDFTFTESEYFEGIFECYPLENGEMTTLLALVEGDKYKVKWDNVEYNCTCTLISTEGVNVPILGNESFFTNDNDNGYPFAIGALGDVIMYMTNDTSSSHNVNIIHQKETIKYLEPKFIKDMYFSEDGGVETLLEPTEFTFANQLTVIAENPTIIPVVGKTYTIAFDNVDYECVAQDISALVGTTAIVIGNLGIEEGFVDTGEPFAIMYQVQGNESALLCKAYDTNATHTIGISTISEVVHQIPSKYVNSYTKEEIDTMFGAYVDEVNTLLGGE